MEATNGMLSNRTSQTTKSFDEIKKIVQQHTKKTHSMLRQSGVPAQPVRSKTVFGKDQ